MRRLRVDCYWPPGKYARHGYNVNRSCTLEAHLHVFQKLPIKGTMYEALQDGFFTSSPCYSKVDVNAAGNEAFRRTKFRDMV